MPNSPPSVPPVSCLFVALREPDLHLSLTPAVILRASNAQLFRALPILLVAVQRIGETPGQRAVFSDVTRALRSRVTACRAVKLRLMTLCLTPGFAAFWDLKIVHRAQCYPAARASLLAQLDKLDREEGAVHAGGVGRESSGSGFSGVRLTELMTEISVSSIAEDLKNDKAQLATYAVTELFGPTGVPQRDHKRRLSVKHKSFLASELVDTLMEKINYSSREHAVDIGRRLQSMGLISKVGRLKTFADDDKIWVANSTQHSDDGVHACITDSKGRVINCWEEAKASTGEEPFAKSELMIACDLIDLQGLDFWTNSIFVPNPVKGQTLGYRMVAHPLAYISFSGDDKFGPFQNESRNGTGNYSNDSPPSPENSQSNLSGTTSGVSSMSLTDLMEDMASNNVSSPGIVSSVKIVKVFSSIARPMIIQLRSAVEGAEIGTDVGHEASDDLLLVKEGDNLGQDLCVELMFLGFNSLWANSPDSFPDPEKAPFTYAYEVFPTSAKQGFMQAVPGLTSLKEFDWDNWVETRGKDPVAINQMVRSAAGSYIGAYIVGAADRHTENVQIQDNFTLLHIDFGYVLGNVPPIDGPQIAIYPAMQAAFEDVGAWDTFVNMCERAFLAVRREAPVVARMAVGMFSKFGFDAHTVRDYITGPSSLNTHESNELVAGAKVRNLVKNSSQNWKTKFKSYSHDKIDPAFYSMLQARFPPAVLAMRIVDSKQQAASRKLDEAAGFGVGRVAVSRVASIREDDD